MATQGHGRIGFEGSRPGLFLGRLEPKPSRGPAWWFQAGSPIEPMARGDRISITRMP